MDTYKKQNPLGNRISRRLRKELADHSARPTDLASLIGVSGSAVSKWQTDANAIAYFYVQAVGFVLGLTPDQLSNTGAFPKPFRTKGCNFKELSENILDVVNRGQIRSESLAIDAKRRAEAYLGTMQPIPLKGPKVMKSFEELGTVITPEAVPAPEPIATPRVADPSNVDRNKVLLMLRNMETFRRETGLEWVIRPDGSLGARRVITEDF